MRFFVCLINVLCLINAHGQTFSEFPGTGFGLLMPDSSFHYSERGFFSKKYRASILLMNTETTPDLSNFSFEKMVEMMRKDLLVPGCTLLSEQTIVPDSGKLMKVSINYDSTDAKPATKGKRGIAWIYFYKQKGSPLMIMGQYDAEYDPVLSDLYYSSLTSFRAVNTERANHYFKNKISITDNYAPLKYAGSVMGGILLNMEGTMRLKGSDSSYCLVVPVDIVITVNNREKMRDYLQARLQIHTKDDVRVLGFGSQVGGNFTTSYYMKAQGNNSRILYICIKADEKGYFEIWGEAYRNNKTLIEVFERIAESLKRAN